MLILQKDAQYKKVNLRLRYYAFEMRTVTVEPENDCSTLTVCISDTYLKCRAGYFF